MQKIYKSELLSTVESLSSKYILIKDTLAVWEDTIVSMIEERISHLISKFIFRQTEHILQDCSRLLK